MNTGTFTIDSTQSALVMVVGMLAISIQTATSLLIAKVINEPNEI